MGLLGQLSIISSLDKKFKGKIDLSKISNIDNYKDIKKFKKGIGYEINGINFLNIDFKVPKQKYLNKHKKFKKYLKKQNTETFKIKDNNSVIDLALKICNRNLKNLKNCDTLIFVTQTPTYLLPSCSSIVQGKLGLKQ